MNVDQRDFFDFDFVLKSGFIRERLRYLDRKMMCFFGKIPIGRRTLLMTLLLLPVLFPVAMILGAQKASIQSIRMQTAQRVPFDQVVTGNGNGSMGGYFGSRINGNPRNPFSRHWQGNVVPPADIHNITLRAKAAGYETVLVTEPPPYDPYLPRVSIRHNIVLYPNNILIYFIIVVYENGYIKVRVSSAYFLRDDWMKTVFIKMFQDVQLPLDRISSFSLEVNWIGEALDIEI